MFTVAETHWTVTTGMAVPADEALLSDVGRTRDCVPDLDLARALAAHQLREWSETEAEFEDGLASSAACSLAAEEALVAPVPWRAEVAMMVLAVEPCVCDGWVGGTASQPS